MHFSLTREHTLEFVIEKKIIIEKKTHIHCQPCGYDCKTWQQAIFHMHTQKHFKKFMKAYCHQCNKKKRIKNKTNIVPCNQSLMEYLIIKEQMQGAHCECIGNYIDLFHGD